MTKYETQELAGGRETFRGIFHYLFDACNRFQISSSAILAGMASR